MKLLQSLKRDARIVNKIEREMYGSKQPDTERIKTLIDQMQNVNFDFGEKDDPYILLFSLLPKSVYQRADLEIIKHLVQHGADVNLKTRGGTNCLLFALMGEDYELIKLLLEAGAKPNCTFRSTGTSLLDLAKEAVEIYEDEYILEERRMRQIVNLLKGYGAKTSDEIENIRCAMKERAVR